MILLLDNYDSFSYNLYQLIGGINPDIQVVRNDEITVADIRRMAPSHLILSPGPGRPEHAGICEEAVTALAGQVPILGVCLGHQAICQAFGGTVTYAKQLMHGKQSQLMLTATCPLFHNLPPVIPAARYHSLAVKEETLPACLRVTAYTESREIMAVQHRDYPIFGLQFHPESILTPQGALILQNFLEVSDHD